MECWPTLTTVDPARRSEPTVEDAEDAFVEGDRALSEGSVLDALRHRVFRIVFVGALLSNIGTWMQNVVLGALAYDLTRSPSFVGIVMFAQLGPLLLLSMVGGLLADIFDRRTLLILVSVEQGILSLVLANVARSDSPSKVALVAIIFGIGVGQAVFGPTYSAILPALVGKRDLPGAISLNSFQMNFSRVIGPVIGALVDHQFGATWVFSGNAVTYLFVIAALLAVRLPPPIPSADGLTGVRKLVAGVHIARRDPVIRRCLQIIGLFSLLSLPFIGQLPVVAAENLKIDPRSGGYGGLFACFGAGAAMGALSIGTVFTARSKERLTRMGLASFGIALAVFSLLRSPAPAYPMILIVGFFYFATITSLSTVLQQALDDSNRGRVMALWIMGFGGTVPLGNLLAGPLIEATNITTVVLGGAVIAVGLACFASFTRPAR
jgi:MFS family permease